jgi:outer membrane lipoprotein-sorting protein
MAALNANTESSMLRPMEIFFLALTLCLIGVGFPVLPAAPSVGSDSEPDAAAIVEASVAYYRGPFSVSVVTMTIHRPDWERVMTIKGWTRGQKDSIFTVVAPAKDKGNATLKNGREMWTYNPKINRTIKIPPSMMSQGWMGSDFSNNDLAKSDSILEDYTHRLIATGHDHGEKVYVIESIPKPEAPVVWGMQRLRIREDHIMLAEEFYDENRQLVKSLTSRDIRMLGGKLFPKIWKMQKAGQTDAYTLLDYQDLSFPENLPSAIFTLSSLKTLKG